MATTAHWVPNSRATSEMVSRPDDGGGVERHLVGAGAQHAPGVLDGADAAAHGEGDEDLLGGVASPPRPWCRARRSWP